MTQSERAQALVALVGVGIRRPGIFCGSAQEAQPVEWGQGASGYGVIVHTCESRGRNLWPLWTLAEVDAFVARWREAAITK